LAVCFWLIYQVKHSHEKGKEFDTKDGNVGGKVQADGEIQRFGRKDLPRAAEIATDAEKHGEDEEEKEVEEEEEENKHEEDGPEKEDKHEEEFNGGRGGGDDEIDENETERTDAEPEHEDELVDEDKEREDDEGGSEENHTENEENEDNIKEEDHFENEDNEGAGKGEHTEAEENEDVNRENHNDSDAASGDQDPDGVDANTHGAREEQYKADDASSEVAHEIQTIIPETGNLTTGQASEIWGKVSFGQGNETQTPAKDDALIQSGIQRRENMDHNITSTSAVVTEKKKYEMDPNKLEDGPLQTSKLQIHVNDHSINGSNSTDIGGEQSASRLTNGAQMELPPDLSRYATREGAMHGEEHTSKSELAEVSSNRTETANSDTQNGAVHGEEHTSKSKLAEVSSKGMETLNNNAQDGAMRREEHTSNSELAEVSSSTAGNVNMNAGEKLNPTNTTLDPSHETNGTDARKAAEDSSLKPDEKLSNSGTSGSDVSSESRPSDESAGSIRHDPIDTSHSSRAQQGSESKTDSSSVPEIRSEGSKSKTDLSSVPEIRSEVHKTDEKVAE